MNVASDLSNVYIHSDVKGLLPLLQSYMTQEGKRGRKFQQLSLGDAASYAILEACKMRGIETSIVPFAVKRVPTVKVSGRVKA